MRWCLLLLLAAAVASTGPGGAGGRGVVSTSPGAVRGRGVRRCFGKLAKERLKALEKVRDKRFFLQCCVRPCEPRRPRPRLPPSTQKYQPFHKTWFGLKYGELQMRN
ncbi:hypothetical protein JYU34_002961 [Plutella xylostella]|uniref:Uncharacterized protein n=1 Tax=Plutella xylostella TaxID=51655 RepID=A0ABQ7R3K9_PLUXY|nr:hypothetical protein JYU34_002961 [Plutella xylostella]